MKTLGKVLAILLALAIADRLLVHGIRALRPVPPKDMPPHAQFLASGYDLSHNEPQGEWIGCSKSENQLSDFCLVTDAKGTVMYEGEYLPLSPSQPLDPAQIHVTRINPEKLWVEGPAEGQPVPVIPLTDGRILVPVDDREALAARWKAQPDELERVSEGSQSRNP